MTHSGGQQYKSRLIDRSQIAAAVDYMLARGISEHAVVMELSRLFYIDMDELNAVLTARAAPALAAVPAAPRPFW